MKRGRKPKRPSYLESHTRASEDGPRLEAKMDIPHPLTWRAIQRTDRDLLPDQSCVYILWAELGGKQHYVGETGSLATRLSGDSHPNLGWKWQVVSYLPVNPGERTAIETLVSRRLPYELWRRPAPLPRPEDLGKISLDKLEHAIIKTVERRPPRRFKEILAKVSSLEDLNYYTLQNRVRKLVRLGLIDHPEHGKYMISRLGRQFLDLRGKKRAGFPTEQQTGNEDSDEAGDGDTAPPRRRAEREREEEEASRGGASPAANRGVNGEA